MTIRAKMFLANVAVLALTLIVAASIQFMPKAHAGVEVACIGCRESSKDDWK